MNDKQFDPLDIRFRQAAEQFEPPYDPEDWNAMERLLDGKKKKRRPFAFWWITDVMMLGLLSVIFLQVSNRLQPPAATQAGPAAGTTLPVAETGLPKTTPPAGAAHSPQSGEKQMTAAPATTARQNLAFTGLPSNPKHLYEPVAAKRHSPRTHSSATALLGKGEDVPANPSSLQAATHPQDTTQIPAATAAKTGSGQQTPQALQPLPPIGQAPVAQADTLAKPVKPAATLPAGNRDNPGDSSTASQIVDGRDSVLPAAEAKPSIAAANRGFFASLVYGQEKSGVKQANPGPWGALYGAMAGYRFNKNWSIRSGVQVTDKNYSGGSGVYKIPPGSYYREITDFTAICNILEIPLMVSYRFGLKKHSAWAVSAGPVTSIMEGEEYHYHYLNNAGGTGYGKKYYSTGNVEWFSGFRISPAYERFLSNRFAVAAEPFLQLPLSGIGEGSVKLYSFGLQLTTSFHFGPLTKK